jgi:hypothetical protein
MLAKHFCLLLQVVTYLGINTKYECLQGRKKKAVSRIQDVYPGSDFFHLGPRIQA